MESYSVEAVLSAVDKNMSSGFAKAASSASSMGDKIGAVTKGIGKSMTVVGAAITAFGVKTVSSYGDFTSSVNKAAVIAGSSNKDLEKNIGSLTNEALKLGKELPISAQDAGNAMVEMARNGASVKDLKEEFPSIARAAAVAGEDLSATATTVQQSMNIWGGGAKNAAKNSALLAIVANKSNAEIGDMQQVFANVGTSAKNMGFSLKDVGIAAGIMTNAGIPAAQASMELNHAFTQMVKPSKTAQGEMDKLGLSFTNAQGEMKPLKQILQETEQATQGMSGAQKTAALNMMFGAAGAKAITPLLDGVAKGTIDGKNGWNSFSDAIDKGAGSFKKANKYLKDNAQNMTHNVGDAIDQMKDAWQGLMFGALNTSAPIIQNMAKKFGDLADKISSSNSPMARFAKTFIAFAPMIGAATTAVGLFLTNISKVGSVMAGAAKFLVSPWGLALTAIMAMAGGLLYAYNQIKPFHDAVNNVGKSLSSAFGTIARDTIGALKGLLEGLKDDFKQIGEAIQTQVGDKLKNADFSDFASRASMAIQNVIAFIGQLLNAITDVIKGFIEVGAVQSIWKALKEVFKAVASIVGAMIRPIQNVVEALSKGSESSSGWEAIGKAIGIVADVISGAIGYVSKFVGWLMKIPYVGTAIGAVVDGFLAFKLISPILKGVMKPLSLFTGKTKAAGKYAGMTAGQIAAMGLKAAGIGIGIGAAAAGIGVFAMGIAKMAETGKAGLIALAAMTASIVVLAGTFALLNGPLTAAIPAMMALSATMLAAGASALMIGGAIALAGTGINLAAQGVMILVQAFVLLSQNMTAIIPTMTAVGQGFAMMIVGFVTALASHIPQVSLAMVTMMLGILTTINTYMPQLMQQGTLLIVNFLNGLAVGMPQIILAATNLILNFLNALTTAIPRIAEAGTNLVVALVAAIGANAPRIMAAGIALIGQLAQAFVTQLPLLVTIMGATMAAIIAVITTYIGAFRSIGGVLMGALKAGLTGKKFDVVGESAKIINSAGTTASQNGKKAFDAAGGSSAIAAANAISNKKGNAQHAGGSLANAGANGVKGKQGQFKSAGSGNGSAAASGIGSKSGAASKAGSSLGKSGASGARGQHGSFSSAGSYLGQGLANGISSMAGSVMNVAASLANRAAAAIRSALKIHSPSRVTREIGYYVAAGMQVGMLKNAGLVADAATDLAMAAVPEVSDFDLRDVYSNFKGNTFSGAMQHELNLTNRTVVEVPVNLDGQEVARITAEPMESELAKRSQRTNRIYGRRS